MSDSTPAGVIEVGDGFWNLRGSFKVLGVLDIGTHCSLVRRASGRYLMLDACALSDEARRWLDARTDGGAAIEAVLHLHPFHTVHVRDAHARYPKARLHGTARHAAKLSELPWDALHTEDAELHALYADDLDFTVPRGVTLAPREPRRHFASVLAIHRASRTLHVDDTINYFRLPAPLRAIREDALGLHPALAAVLEPRRGAVAEFRAWGRELVERCRGVENLCAAHGAALLGRRYRGAPIAERVELAIAKVERTLRAHEQRHG